MEEQPRACGFVARVFEFRDDVSREESIRERERLSHGTVGFKIHTDGPDVTEGHEPEVAGVTHTEVKCSGHRRSVRSDGCTGGRCRHQHGLAVLAKTQGDVVRGQTQESAQLSAQGSPAVHEPRADPRVGECRSMPPFFGGEKTQKRVRVGTAIDRHHPDPLWKVHPDPVRVRR
jgi:hypothetical protein